MSADKTKFAGVFAAHPKATELWAVGEVPFLEEKHARNYANTLGVKYERIARGGKPSDAEKTDKTEKA